MRLRFGFLLLLGAAMLSCALITTFEGATRDRLRFVELAYVRDRMLFLEGELRDTESARKELAEIVFDQQQAANCPSPRLSLFP